MINDDSDDFSFSGLKTSVRYFLRDHPELIQPATADQLPPDSSATACSPAFQPLRDLCASAQSAIVDVLVTKGVRAARRLRVPCVTASGGVACNRQFRSDLQRTCDRAGLVVRLAEPQFCTDNAAMIGILAERKLASGARPTDLDDDIQVNWIL
jgi:N6-L-threonylcarbamoyladenine synthase